MKYNTLLKMTGRDWHKDTLLSLADVYKAKTEYTVPMALDQYLHDHSTVETLLLHLDNDEVGRGATQGIIKNLGGKYRVKVTRAKMPPPGAAFLKSTLLLGQIAS